MICYLIRHGKDPDNVRGGWSGHGLTPEGMEQVRALSAEMAGMGICRIYSSDLRRAKETAQILSASLDCPVEYLPRFREADNGSLAGMDNALALARYPGVFWSALEYTEPYPNGESPEGFFRRIQAAWGDLKGMLLRNPSADIALVTHGGVIEAILCIENGIPFSNQKRHFAAPHARPIPIEITPETDIAAAP